MDLNKIAQKRYGKNYDKLCNDRKRIVETLYKTRDFKMPCPNSIKKKGIEEDRVLKIFKRDEILELVKLKRENPEEYKRTLKDVAEVLKDIAEVVEGVNK